MTQVSADFETGVNGSTIATSDTGSATAFDAVGIGTGAAAKYDNVNKYGALSAKFTTGGTSTTAFVQWTTAFPDQTGTTWYGRFYIWLNEAPAVSRITVHGQNETPSTSFRINVNTSRQVELIDSGAIVRATSTTALPTGQWNRVEFKVVQSSTVGVVECKIFTSPDSSTPDETFDTFTTSGNINVLATCTRIAFGMLTNSTSKTMWMDNIVAAAAAYPGPSGVAAAAFVPKFHGAIVL